MMNELIVMCKAFFREEDHNVLVNALMLAHAQGICDGSNVYLERLGTNKRMRLNSEGLVEEYELV